MASSAREAKEQNNAVVIPTLNEENGIGSVLSEVTGALQNRKFALLVVDRGSELLSG
jgi:glycosyltransferase involved in cell wall biosynthesis